MPPVQFLGTQPVLSNSLYRNKSGLHRATRHSFNKINVGWDEAWLKEQTASSTRLGAPPSQHRFPYSNFVTYESNTKNENFSRRNLLPFPTDHLLIKEKGVNKKVLLLSQKKKD